jgi:hypothetical protein
VCHRAGLNYFQSITPSLSAGGEFFWLGGQLRSGLGLALRISYENRKHGLTMHPAVMLSLAGLNYFQSITPSLSAGGEFFWLGGQLRSGLGLALRHTGEQHIATCQVASTGILSAQYAHKVTDKVRGFCCAVFMLILLVLLKKACVPAKVLLLLVGGQLGSRPGLALRHTGEQHIATCQVASTGILSAQYAHKVTDKVRRLRGVTFLLLMLLFLL